MTHSTKKQYEAPEAEIIRFDSEDIITAQSGHETRLPFITGSSGGGGGNVGSFGGFF